MLISFVSICVEQDWACAAETFMTDTISIFVFSVANPAVASPACSREVQRKTLDPCCHFSDVN